MLLLLTSHISVSVVLKLGGITVFDGLYFFWRHVRKCKITRKVLTYWFYFTNILVKHGAFRKNPSTTTAIFMFFVVVFISCD